MAKSQPRATSLIGRPTRRLKALQRLHDYLVDMETISVISDQMRTVVESEWPSRPQTAPAEMRNIRGIARPTRTPRSGLSHREITSLPSCRARHSSQHEGEGSTRALQGGPRADSSGVGLAAPEDLALFLHGCCRSEGESESGCKACAEAERVARHCFFKCRWLPLGWFHS